MNCLGVSRQTPYVLLFIVTAMARSHHALAQEKHEVVEYAGRLEPSESVDIRSRATGFLTKVHFKEGETVKEGDLLFELDSLPYQAELARAEAAVKLAQARLKLQEERAKILEPLVAKGAVSREEYAKAVAELGESKAGLNGAAASLDIARLNLSYTQIRAPISGRIGRALLTRGNLVKADDGNLVMTTIVAVERMYVYLNLEERTVLRLIRLAKKEMIRDVPVDIRLADEKAFSRQGKIDFVDNRVDPKTGTLRVRAVLANRDGLLIPGMSVRVRLPAGDAK